jgi:tetratricopeptide (TPR) repeat protein
MLSPALCTGINNATRVLPIALGKCEHIEMRVGIAVTLLIWTVATSAVRAQSLPGVSKLSAAEHQAGVFADSASVALKNGDFDTAIDMFTKAYKAVPLPVYLFDIAQANRKKAEALHATAPMKAAGFRDVARTYYNKFLETHPTNEELELKARGLKARLDDQWAAEHPKEEAARLAEEEQKRDAALRAEQARLAEERRKQREHEEQIRSAVTKAKVDSDRSKAQVLEVSGGVAMGLGVVGAGVGMYLGFKARSLADDLTRQDVFDQSSINRGKQDERDMAIAYATSGVLLVGGAIAFWLGHRVKERAEDESVMSMTVAPTPHGGAILVRGSF